ncbi:MAG: YraN family protein [Chloroflexota bacterium]
MSKKNQKLGKWGEQEASNYLSKKGYKILGKNIRTPHGEIDILASLDQVLTFVEVKTRGNTAFGNPEISIDSRKLGHMEASALFYVQTNNYLGTWQCDAIAILKSNSKLIEIVHFENVIS